jgi:hypothetical protein
MGEDPEPAAPALPVTEMLLAHRERGPGDTLAVAAARSDAADAREARDRAAQARDPDEFAANLITRGYSPGLIGQLSQRLGDTMAELEAEREKIAKGERRHEHVMRAHQAGQISAWQIPDALGEEGDAQRAEMLERRAERLRQQIAETQEMIAPPERRQADGVDAASRAARATLAEVTGGAERRPFGGGAEASRSTEHSGPGCWVCAEARKRDAARNGVTYGSPSYGDSSYAEIARSTDDGYLPATACSGCGYVRCQCQPAQVYA